MDHYHLALIPNLFFFNYFDWLKLSINDLTVQVFLENC